MTKITIRPETREDFHAIADLVRYSFKHGTKYSDGEKEEKQVEELRSKENYVPELALVAEKNGEMCGYFMLTKFPIGNNSKDVLILSPVAVDYTMQDTGIGTSMIELGLEKAKKLGYNGVIVEGNPDYYHRFGFVTSTEFGIEAGDDVELPLPECLMALELSRGGLKGVKGKVDYSMYDYMN